MNSSVNAIFMKKSCSIFPIFALTVALTFSMFLIVSCSKEKNEPIPQAQSDLKINSFTPVSGGEGTTVTIVGSDFDEKPDNNVVTFNNTPGAVSVAGKTQLIVIVPAGASTGPIQVTSNNKTAVSVSDFTIISDQN